MGSTENNLSNNKNVYRNRHIFYVSSIALLIFTFYIFTQRWYGFLIETSVLQIGIITIVIALLILKPQKNGCFNFFYTRVDLMWTLSVKTILLFMIYTATTDIKSQYFMYISGLLFLWFAKVDIDRYKLSFKLIKIGSIIYAFGTIFHFFFTDMFHSITFPFVTNSVIDRTLELVKLGYYPGLGFGQPAMAAGPIVLGIGIISVNILKSTKINKFNAVLLIILFTGLLMTGKRSILIWTIITFILIYYFVEANKSKIISHIKLFLLMLFGATFLWIIFNYFESISIFERIISTIQNIIQGQDFTSGRLVLYEKAWELFLENPFFGIGWGQFIIITSGQLLSRDLTVHNVYLQLLAETGIVGFGIIILTIIYVFIKTLSICKHVLKNDIDNKWRIGVLFSLFYQLFFLLYCITENPFYNIFYMFAYFFSVSIINSFSLSIDKSNKKKSR